MSGTSAPGPPTPRPHWRRLRWWLALYLALLLLSYVWRARTPEPQPPGRPGPLHEAPGLAHVQLPQVRDGAALPGTRSTLVYRDSGPREAPLVIGLHGSPGDRSNLRRVADQLDDRYRWILPDLPGFGDSQRAHPDYSIRSHARTVQLLMAELGRDRAHLVGFSMGGGVALELAQLLGADAQSIALVSAIGVQELELLGSYPLNHALHGLQLAGLWGLRAGFPHFGALDRSFLGVEYARNFFDTDQRPLRGYLEAWGGPLLIVHGERDSLVPFGAALEHARIVPQARLERFEAGHFLVFAEAPAVAQRMGVFLDEVEAGRARRRTDALPAELARAAAPFDAGEFPLRGFLLGAVMALIAVCTMASEDLTCIGAGALVSAGRLPYWAAVIACFLGIFIGDLLLYGLGRLFGRRVAALPPLSWVLSEARMQRAAGWFESKGLIAIFLTRFTPGMRLPTYLAAGAMRAHFPTFALYFAIAAGVWTPILVWLSSRLGGTLTEKVEVFRDSLPLALLGTVVIGVVGLKLVLPMLTWRGRRMLGGSLAAKRRWEFWPAWVVYGALSPYLGWLALKHRSATAFCAANPGIPEGGVVGESKVAILEALRGAGDACPAFESLPACLAPTERRARLLAFADRVGGYPLVVKPDAGQRGSGVLIARSEAAALEYLERAPIDLLAQAFVPGEEFGVFYSRRTGEAAGRITSITVKRLAAVIGDGHHTLEQLILMDDRARCMAGYYLERNAARLDEVVDKGERVELGELGTHARGAIFLDGADLATPELEREVERIARAFRAAGSSVPDGFQFGRFDLRAPDTEALRAGRDLRVIELNGVTSEPSHIYDPRHPFRYGLGTLARQWRECFEIGAANIAAGRGAAPGPLGLARAWFAYRREQRRHRGG